MKKRYILLFLLFIPVLLHGQISGVVVNSSGMPLTGVMVQTADGSVSAVTDLDGNFELNVSADTPLTVAFLGYRSVNVAASPGMQVVLREKGAKPHMPQSGQDDLPWSVFILANGMTSFPFAPAVGLTVGMVRKGGWYVNAMTGFGFHMEDQTLQNGYDTYNGHNDLPFYTGETSKQTFSVTAGGVARLGNAPVYWYGGLGWAYKSLTLETNNGKWVAYYTSAGNNMSPLHSLALETGIMANIKGFALSVGYEAILGLTKPYSEYTAAHEIKIGLGGMFDCKRRAAK